MTGNLAALATIALSACCAIAPATAQQRISLAGTWSLRTDPLDDAHPVPHAVPVPAPFEAALGSQFDGIVWYECALPIPADFHGRARVEFAAVATQATVFCNGQELGRHLGGWTPFRVDVTDALAGHDQHTLRVRVDELVGHNTQGFLPIVQPHFGGIWQDVTLCLDSGPVLDRIGLFTFGEGDGTLRFRVPLLGGETVPGCTIDLRVCSGDREFAAATLPGPGATGTLRVPDVRPWSPSMPQLYTLRLAVRLGDTEVDNLERRIGFRDLRADGTRVLWNGEPLQMRGVLHWGYSPPHQAPPSDAAFWRQQLVDFRSLGFNCIKCCLWVPPACFYDLCDELGLLVWQEYPTWHPQMDQAHKQELLAEYGEFFAHDRSHPSVAFRSITCETGQGADLDVVKSLFEACKAAVPQTLVVDDSSWIGWQRITDFWDEHPYGNNSWLPGRLADFVRHIEEHGKKPLLLGECIAADTWADRDRWNATYGEAPLWWRPDCWAAQGPAEAWLRAAFGQATLASLRPISLDFGMAMRKFQIEQLRLRIPDAGYVVSVARDFGKARMGLYDDFGELKWRPEDWAWQGDTMVCLDQPGHGHTLGARGANAQVRVAHYGRGVLRGVLRLWSDDVERDEVSVPLELQPGTVSVPIVLPIAGQPTALRRVRVRAELTGSQTVHNEWDLWQTPASAEPEPAAPDLITVTALTPDVLTALENGARVLLHAGDRKGSLRTESMWFLKGAPFAPPHPIHDRLPRDLLLELCAFDLESGRVMPWDLLKDQVDPMLAFWETHDIAEVRWHLLAFDCRVGKGRLLATTLALDPSPDATGGATDDLRRHVTHLLGEHLAHGPAPQRELSPATIAALRASLTERKLDLPVWRFRTDPQNEGRAADWQDPATDVSTAAWRDLRAGSHWENQADDLKQYTGVAWYRLDVDVPADWQGLPARAVFEGVDDSFELWLNGEPAGTFGDEATHTSIWLERQVADLGQRLTPGRTNTLVLRVVDHAGAGGLWKPAFLTTGPTDAMSRLLQ